MGQNKENGNIAVLLSRLILHQFDQTDNTGIEQISKTAQTLHRSIWCAPAAETRDTKQNGLVPGYLCGAIVTYVADDIPQKD